MSLRRCILPLIFILAFTSQLLAQEQSEFVLENGTMWTFDRPPVEYFTQTYGFTPEASWFEDVRMSALRFANHCSASFVSNSGLVMTNYHCGIDAVISVSKPGEDLRKDGFYAARQEDERRVDGLYVDQLVEIIDVTEEVAGAMAAGESAEQAFQLRDSKIGEIEERLKGDDMYCQVVTFYSGARYSAYRYRRYDDVRLVFSSELSFAFFGGIYDFWSYPRYSFDCDLFRVYENGKPLKPKHYFRWSREGAAPGDPIFVVGNPGRTGRLVTADMLTFERDIRVPYLVQLLTDRKEILEQWIKAHPEDAAGYFDEFFGVVNGQEAYYGRLLGLQDDELIQRRRDFDTRFRAAVMKDAAMADEFGDLWTEIADNTAKRRTVGRDLLAMRTNGLGVSAHVARAAQLVMYLEQMKLPEEERQEMYRGNSATLIRRKLAQPLETVAQIERMTLQRQLALMQHTLDETDPLMSEVLGGLTPEQAADRLLEASVLDDSAAVAALLEDEQAFSSDPFLPLAAEMLRRAKTAAATSAPLATRLEELRGDMGRALYAVYGDHVPPDATFTLRISDGVVRGYVYNGTIAPPITTFHGMFDRNISFAQSDLAWDAMMNGNAFDLPPKWKNVPGDFDADTPMNFVSTCDIIGGNSGSPVINVNREIVGLAFDGNIESLPGEFIFAPDKGNRTISVHSAGILESLRHVYKADRIVSEIESSR
ncbi:S46 family peptidase [bacterium]|nr:S46 family peptidase [bacterium]